MGAGNVKQARSTRVVMVVDNSGNSKGTGISKNQPNNHAMSTLTELSHQSEATISTKPTTRSMSWHSVTKNNNHNDSSSVSLRPIVTTRSQEHSTRSNQSSGRIVSQRLLMSLAGSSQTASGILFSSLSDFPSSQLLPASLWDAQTTCSQIASIRRSFISYVKGMQWMDLLIPRLVEILNKRLPLSDVRDHIAFYDYIVAPRHRTSSNDPRDREEISTKMMKCTQLKVRDSMDAGAASFRRSGNERICTCFSDDQLKDFLFATIWPLFQQSSEFQSSSSSGVSTSFPLQLSQQPLADTHDRTVSSSSVLSLSADLATSSSSTDMVNGISSRNIKAVDAERLRRFREILQNTAAQLTNEEANTLLIDAKWVDRLMDHIEFSPYSISVSSATQQGFPLIFVNKAFESTTLYNRIDVLGQSCNILQCSKTDKEYREKISSTLAKGSGIKVAITNRRKDGSSFNNFLAVRGIHDREGRYKFVLGVQYDVGKEDSSLRDIKLIEDLMVLLGNVMMG